MTLFPRSLFFVVLLSTVFFPVSVFAQNAVGCSKEGYSILTVNGILTDENGAKDNLSALKQRMPKRLSGEIISFDYIHNDTHLQGVGDVAEVIFQKTFEDFANGNYDSSNMLLDVSRKLKTQKVLFVAHSQGNLYANVLYKELVTYQRDIPKDSIGIYGVATPATYVSGGGKWITSDTDKMISGLVHDKIHWAILPTNAHIEYDPAKSSNGHGFVDVYLEYEGERIVREIKESLSLLKKNEIQRPGQPCVRPPSLGMLHKAGGVFYGVLDPVSRVAANVGEVSAQKVSGILSFVNTSVREEGLSLGRTVYAVRQSINNTAQSVEDRLSSAVEKTFKSIADTTTSIQFGPILPTPPASANLAGVAAASPVHSNPQPATPSPTLADLARQLEQARAALAALSASLPVSLREQNTPGLVAGASTTKSITATPPDPIKLVAGVMSTEGAPGGIQLAPLPPLPSDPFPTTPEASTTDPIPDTTAPLAPVITFPTASSFSTTTIIFSGTGEASSTLLVSWNEGPLSVVKVFPVSRRVPSIGIEGEDGSWSVSLLLPEGTTVVVFALRDDAGNLSESMAFTAVITLPTPLPVVRTALPGDILFSEISALPGREYVELYNQSDASIDLSGTNLLIPDVFHSIPLVGTVPPHGYWLISRAVIPGVVTDQVIDVPSWDDLGQSDLRLSNFLTIIDELPYCADWCGQVGPGFVIERFSFSLPTADYAKNWSMPIDHLTDSPGFGFGTPRMQNTLRYLLTLGSTLSESMTTSGATYLINNALTVEQGVTLTLSAGTTVEYVHGAQLIVVGGLVAEGTSIDPVILRGYSSDDPSLRGSVGLFVSGTITLTETDILNANSVVLASASSTFDHVTMIQMSNGISVNEGSMRSNDLTLQDIDGPALLLSDTDAMLSSTTITGAGWSGASSVVQVSGGSVEISDLSLAQCGPTVSNGISLYAASTTIDGLSLSECGTTVGIYISGYSKATITDATISSELGIGVMATGGADLVIASTTLSESAVGLHSNTAEVSGEGLTIVNNFSGVVDGGQSLLSIHQSTISGNNNGVTSAGPSSVVDMSNNYWGSPTGPTLPGQLPDTNGDAVSTGVVTDPYLTADPTLP